jgi:uroporphyrinogen-III synthase
MTAPLAGRRILVTRSAGQVGKLSEGLRALGAEPVEVPVLEIVPPDSFVPLDECLRNLQNYDWLILTSTNTLRILCERAAHLGITLGATRPQVAAVGRATAAAAEAAGLHVDLVPEAQVAEGLVAALGEKVRNARVLFPRAVGAREVIPGSLRATGATVDVVDAYRNVMPTGAPAQLQAALQQGIDAATFTSSSSVTHLADAALAAGLTFPFAGVPAVSIGPITSATLRESGWPISAEAALHDVPGLLAALTIFFSGK